MNRVFSLLIAVLLFSGCAQAVRYSPYELKAFSPEVQEQIKRGEIALGMNQQQVRYSWGGPAAVKVLPLGEDGKLREEWLYTNWGIGPYRTILTFTGAELTDIVSNDPNLQKQHAQNKDVIRKW